MKDQYYNGISGSSIEFLGDRVRKSVHHGNVKKLKAQYDNLKNLHGKIRDYSVKVFGWRDSYYDMAFCPGVSFDVYCTMSTQQAAFYRLKEIITVLLDNLYSQHKNAVNVVEYVDYLLERSHQYGNLGPDVSTLTGLLNQIKSRLNGSTLLEDLPGGLIHGDLTFENIMVTADSFVLLDSNPAPGGIASFTMDIGKIRQSLFSLYELPKYTGPAARAGLKATYSYIADRFSLLFPYWNEAMDLQSRFYESSHYIRLLDYKHTVNPDLSCLYYQKAVDTLKEVITDLSLKQTMPN